jgi:hypothetical protein
VTKEPNREGQSDILEDNSRHPNKEEKENMVSTEGIEEQRHRFPADTPFLDFFRNHELSVRLGFLLLFSCNGWVKLLFFAFQFATQGGINSQNSQSSRDIVTVALNFTIAANRNDKVRNWASKCDIMGLYKWFINKPYRIHRWEHTTRRIVLS